MLYFTKNITSFAISRALIIPGNQTFSSIPYSANTDLLLGQDMHEFFTGSWDHIYSSCMVKLLLNPFKTVPILIYSVARIVSS